ncbi:GNAT family N-acetyltransferase [Desnuesiella massiliensis]|uniref:GNAT family N-acetyltransferase n=1 Tax=Desnuesiella massiliensis TaxID=1650662 RepID=UPI0006E3B85F|nr:GNAT family N-acetyltransferase [Desnuesiella massiliensis]
MENLLEKAQGYEYNSVMYKDMEDIGEASKENVFTGEDSLFIAKEKPEEIEIFWGADSKESFFKGINSALNIIQHRGVKAKRVFLEFIPSEFAEEMEELGFKVVSEWVDFWAQELSNMEVQPSTSYNVKLIEANEYGNAGQVLRSCNGYSRGFKGESDEWVKEWNEGDNSCILVAAMNNEIIGVCCLNIYGFDSEKGPVLWLREIAVAPAYQGKGIGYSLIEQAFQWGIAKGAKRSFLACDADNIKAIKLYGKFGYKRKAERGQINMAK